MSGAVLVFVEHGGGEPERLSLEALAFARGLGAPVEAVALGSGADRLAGGFGGHGASVVHVAADARLDEYAPAAWASAVAGFVASSSPVALVAAGSDRGNEVLAHVAARTGRPMAANVLAAEPGSPWRLTRQRWAGSLLEDCVLDADVALLSVAPHAVAAGAGGGPAASLAPFDAAVSDADLAVRVVGREAPAASGVSLTDAKVVVGGGRGVGSEAAFAELEELASLLGGAVGVSRAVTSLGWRPHAEQIGQTGLRIAPDLYIACGISGAIQHMVGCAAAKRLLAINSDPDSPIMQAADYAVVGDLHAVVPAISAEIRRRRGT